MNELKKLGVKFINNEDVAAGHEEWIIQLMSGMPVEYRRTDNESEIIQKMNYQYLNGIYKIIVTGGTAHLIIFDDYEIIEIGDNPNFKNEIWTYSAALTEYESYLEDKKFLRDLFGY